MQRGFHVWGHGDLSRFLGLGVLAPQSDKASLKVYAVPRQADNFTEALSELVGRQQHWAKVWLCRLIEFAPFLLRQDSIPCVPWIGEGNLRSWVDL